MTLNWQDGLPFSPRFGDVYFSRDSGLAETRHVFLQGNRLTERYTALPPGGSLAIGETGFGTGLNFLCTWQLFGQVAPPGTSLDFFSVEKYPLDDDELRAALALWPELQPLADELLPRWRRRVPGWNRWHLAGGRVRLTLVLGDVLDALQQLPERCMDAWFLDGFAPAKNPEMWSNDVLAGIARTSRPGATLATYTSAGWVRRGLQQAGFEVARVPGFGSKREMVCGVLPLPLAGDGLGEKIIKPRSALVIGGGIAGCAAAHALAQRGIAVTLLERAPHLASAASGNPRGILHARFGAGMNPLQRFVLASYGHALALFDTALPVDAKLRAECGLLQLGCTPEEEKRIARLAAGGWPPHLMQAVNAAQASELAGMEMVFDGLWFPGGGWVVPPALCERLADNARIERRCGHTVETLERSDVGWHAAGQGWELEADIAVVCCAHSASKLAPFAHFPLTPVRGQVSLLPAIDASRALHAVVCGDGYCAPAVDGLHVIGATHTFNDESVQLRAADHADNLAKLAGFAPMLRTALNEQDIEHLDGRASVRCSAPGALPFVGEVEEGLYCSLAHGTRGLLTAGLAGELIAALVCDTLPPLPAPVQSALAPLPRVNKASWRLSAARQSSATAHSTASTP